MKKKVNYVVENRIITNFKNDEDLIELFNKKIAIIILNIENNLMKDSYK